MHQLAAVTLGISMVLMDTPTIAGPQQRGKDGTRTPKNSPAVQLCRSEAAARLKYLKTIQWTDLAKEEGGDQYLVSGTRDAKPPNGEVTTQQYTCRVQKTATGAWKLKMIQLFKEHTKTGKDVFETFR